MTAYSGLQYTNAPWGWKETTLKIWEWNGKFKSMSLHNKEKDGKNARQFDAFLRCHSFEKREYQGAESIAARLDCLSVVF